ncbi:endonuclease domain-containing protein [Longispora urticae]
MRNSCADLCVSGHRPSGGAGHGGSRDDGHATAGRVESPERQGASSGGPSGRRPVPPTTSASDRALPVEQGGRSATRGVPAPEHVDHDHEFGNVRGNLCFQCSGGLGQFQDNVGSLRKAIEYLKETTWHRDLIHPGVFQLSSPLRGPRRSPSS